MKTRLITIMLLTSVALSWASTQLLAFSDGQDRCAQSTSPYTTNQQTTITPGKEPFFTINSLQGQRNGTMTFNTIRATNLAGLQAIDIENMQNIMESLGFDPNTRINIQKYDVYQGAKADFLAIGAGNGKYGRGKIIINNDDKTYIAELIGPKGNIKISVEATLSGYQGTDNASAVLRVKMRGEAWFVGKMLQGIGTQKQEGSFSDILSDVKNKEIALALLEKIENSEFVTVIAERSSRNTYEVAHVMGGDGAELMSNQEIAEEKPKDEEPQPKQEDIKLTPEEAALAVKIFGDATEILTKRGLKAQEYEAAGKGMVEIAANLKNQRLSFACLVALQNILTTPGLEPKAYEVTASAINAIAQAKKELIGLPTVLSLESVLNTRGLDSTAYKASAEAISSIAKTRQENVQIGTVFALQNIIMTEKTSSPAFIAAITAISDIGANTKDNDLASMCSDVLEGTLIIEGLETKTRVVIISSIGNIANSTKDENTSKKGIAFLINTLNTKKFEPSIYVAAADSIGIISDTKAKLIPTSTLGSLKTLLSTKNLEPKAYIAAIRTVGNISTASASKEVSQTCFAIIESAFKENKAGHAALYLATYISTKHILAGKDNDMPGEYLALLKDIVKEKKLDLPVLQNVIRDIGIIAAYAKDGNISAECFSLLESDLKAEKLELRISAAEAIGKVSKTKQELIKPAAVSAIEDIVRSGKLDAVSLDIMVGSIQNIADNTKDDILSRKCRLILENIKNVSSPASEVF